MSISVPVLVLLLISGQYATYHQPGVYGGVGGVCVVCGLLLCIVFLLFYRYGESRSLGRRIASLLQARVIVHKSGTLTRRPIAVATCETREDTKKVRSFCSRNSC